LFHKRHPSLFGSFPIYYTEIDEKNKPKSQQNEIKQASEISTFETLKSLPENAIMYM